MSDYSRHPDAPDAPERPDPLFNEVRRACHELCERFDHDVRPLSGHLRSPYREMNAPSAKPSRGTSEMRENHPIKGVSLLCGHRFEGVRDVGLLSNHTIMSGIGATTLSTLGYGNGDLGNAGASNISNLY